MIRKAPILAIQCIGTTLMCSFSIFLAKCLSNLKSVVKMVTSWPLFVNSLDKLQVDAVSHDYYNIISLDTNS